MAYKTTTVQIDEEKLDLAKKRNIILKNLINEALDIALNVEVFSNLELENWKTEINQELELLDVKYGEYVREYEKQKNELNLKLKMINKEIEKNKLVYNETTQKDDYNTILRVIHKTLGSIEDNPKGKQLISEYQEKYNIPDDDTFYEQLMLDYSEYLQTNKD